MAWGKFNIQADKSQNHLIILLTPVLIKFITDVFVGMPTGFCPWAWDDIYKVLVGFAAHGNFGMWSQNKNVLVACCTDGTRPVYFKIEKIET